MSKFIEGLKQETNWKLTENGQDALVSTTDDLLDLFATIGALRNRKEEDIINLFSKAFYQDKLLAMKILFYSRNIRGLGQGERRTFRIIAKWMAETYPEIMKKNLHLIAGFGRFDDLYVFVGTPLEKDAFEIIKKQWHIDHGNYLAATKYANYIGSKVNYCDGEKHADVTSSVSLLAKWLKSVNTSSEESNKLGKLTSKYLGLSEKDYRKRLSALRSYLKIIEKKMSNNKWEEINYSQVPSKAMTNYRNAFVKHDEERFNNYIESVSKGEVKINASALYPYDLVAKVFKNSGGFGSYRKYKHDEVIEQQWRALPNYIEGENNILVMADTSGSMTWGGEGNVKAIDISISLAVYFAERNKGAYKDKFITFSSRPSFIELKGEKLVEKLSCIPDICESTNLEAAFDLVLNTAVKNSLTSEDLPKSIIVISYMEFDSCVYNNSQASYYNSVNRWTFYDTMKNKYAQYGYTIPNIVFWNVNARNNTFHAFSEYEGVQMASGASPSVFQSILTGNSKTPIDLMMEVLNNSVFDCVTI